MSRINQYNLSADLSTAYRAMAVSASMQDRTNKLISLKCRKYALVNCVSIGSGNGLPPVRPQASIWSNADLSRIWSLGPQ